MSEGVRRIDPQESPFRLHIRRSSIDRHGVFAAGSIPAHRKILEYRGEKISVRARNKRRRAIYAAGKRPSRRTYSFRLNRYWVIDAARGGNGAELVNHCCTPNMKVRIARGHITYWSARKIRAGEEITIDYRFRWTRNLRPCHCGSPKCRGTINVKPPRKPAAR
jgi:SET domain-containing protein